MVALLDHILFFIRIDFSLSFGYFLSQNEKKNTIFLHEIQLKDIIMVSYVKGKKMTGLFRKAGSILNGVATLDVKFKYTVICFCMGMIHGIFLCAFAVGRIMPLVWYNVGAIVFYLYITLRVNRKNHLVFSVNAVYWEVLVCAVFSCLMLGWEWGFSMYTLSMIPAMYYLAYTIPGMKSRIGVPTMMSAGIGAAFILTRAACGRMEPFYVRAKLLPDMQISFYYFNISIAIAVLLLFSTLFAVEIVYMQKQLEKENAYLGEVANIDPLTHLLNRRSMNERLKTAIETSAVSGEVFCIALIDIDDFKRVNDSYGHDCGDEVLVSVAKIISANVGTEDAVCRWGGEEILVMIKDELTAAKSMAEIICRKIRENEVIHEGNTVKVTMTVGMTEYQENQRLQDMIAEADKNMYYGKHHGKNQVVVTSDRQKGDS